MTNRLRARRASASLLAAALLGGAGVAIALVISGDAASVDDKTTFCSEFVPNMEASNFYKNWAKQNSGEKTKWITFRTGICASQNPVVPIVTTSFGKALVASGKMALPEEPPTTTTTTTTTPPPPPPPPVSCANGINDDPAEDTLIDFPADPGCSSPSDDSELGNPPPPPPPPPPPGNCTQTISSGLSAAIAGAAAGATICLNTGSYGNLTLSGYSRASDVTVRPTAGASVSIGYLNFQNVDHLHFTGLGGSMVINGIEMDTTSGTSDHLTFDHATWTYGATIFTRGSNQAILFDSGIFDNLPAPGFEGRITLRGFNNSSPSGVVISNSHFSGGCSDGVQLIGGVNGVQIGPGNEFENIRQGSCDPAHVDPIQAYDCNGATIIGNYLHDNETGIMSGDNLCNSVTVTNNVIESLGASQALYCGACENWVVEHNVIYGTSAPNNVFFGFGNGNVPASGNLVRNNVFTNGRSLSTNQSGWGTNSYNLNSGKSGTGEITGTPVFVGGANPTTYAGWRLAAGSPGKGVGSGGTDMGIP